MTLNNCRYLSPGYYSVIYCLILSVEWTFPVTSNYFDSVCSVAVPGGFIKSCVTVNTISSLDFGLEIMLQILEEVSSTYMSWHLLCKYVLFTGVPLIKQDLLSKFVKDSVFNLRIWHSVQLSLTI